MNEKPEKAIVNFAENIIKQIKKGKNPGIEIATRALSNVTFNEKKQKLELGNKKTTRQFFNIGHVRKFTQTVEISKIAKELIESGKHDTLRAVFYMAKRTLPRTNINLVDEQTESDKVIEDLELITGFPREQFNINANKEGTVAGNAIIIDKGDTIDWSKLGSGGWSIPSSVEGIKFKKVNAKYILYMEKAGTWERLNEDKFWKKQNCLMVTSQGQTTRGIRRLLQRLHTEYNLPVYVLTDLDPWGHYIYSVLKFGSISLAHHSDVLAIPKAKFLGITVNDVKKYGLEKHIIKFKDVDISRIKQVAEYDWFKANKKWQKEFTALKKLKGKVEIQALSARGISFISEKYLPEKIKAKDWIE